MTAHRSSTKSPARQKYDPRLWNAVEGAVIDAFHHHPEYLTRAGRYSAVESVTKRAALGANPASRARFLRRLPHRHRIADNPIRAIIEQAKVVTLHEGHRERSC